MSFDVFSILAHRGCSSLAPENTLASFRAAKQHGASGVELDASLLSDNTVVVFHDEKVDRCTDGTGLLHDFTLDEIRKLDAGSWFSPQYKGEKVPTLDETLTLLNEINLDLNLEIKSRIGEEKLITGEIQKILKSHSAFTQNNLLLSSFNYTALQYARELFPHANIAILYEDRLPDAWLQQARDIDACAINLNVEHASKETIQSVQTEKYKTYIWTVDAIDEAERLKKLNVNGIITNRPQDLMEI